MTTAAHPYSKVEPLLCSTRCEILVGHSVEKTLKSGPGIPKELVKMILEYVSYSRNEEYAFNAKHVSDLWNACSKDEDFCRRALATHLFSFATHGVEKTLPEPVLDRFNAVVARIDGLYPSTHFDGSTTEVISSPLDLPRVATVTFRDATFDPYRPSNWGTENGLDRCLPVQERWQSSEIYIEVQASSYTDSYLPSVLRQNESLFLAPYLAGQKVYCPLIVQFDGDISRLDELFCTYNTIPPDGDKQYSFLPIAQAAVNSTGRKKEDLFNWALIRYSYPIQWRPFDFCYRRTSKLVLENEKKKEGCTIL